MLMSHLEATFALFYRAAQQDHDNLPDLVPEYVFHDTRKWRFDFALPDERLAIEIEGGTRSGKSRHVKHKGYTEDCDKYNEAALYGWAVLRFTSEHLKDPDRVIAPILRYLEIRTQVQL